jgi:hypothetical protein
VYLPRWLSALERHAPDLEGVRIEALPTSVPGAIPLARTLKNAEEGYVPGDQLAARLSWMMSAAVCAALVRKGWTLDTAPGRGFRVSDGRLECAPFTEVEAVVFGRTRPDEWIEFCAKAGLTGSIRELVTPVPV